MSDALDADDLTAFQTAFSRLTVAYQAMAENPPDEVLRRDASRSSSSTTSSARQVSAATTTDDLTGIALQVQADERAEDLETVRDYGAANC